MMTPGMFGRENRDRAAAKWAGSFIVVACLFAPPDEPAMDKLRRRREYFDIRTGDTWDLFFPGYFKATDEHLEREAGSRRLSSGAREDWYFSAASFDELRADVEGASGGRWAYSGGADLVLANAYVPDDGDIAVDWESVQAGQLTGSMEASLPGVIERITRDLQSGREDPSYGVADIVGRSESPASSSMREFMVSTLAEIAAALMLRGSGL
jgi:hypothetical protein